MKLSANLIIALYKYNERKYGYQLDLIIILTIQSKDTIEDDIVSEIRYFSMTSLIIDMKIRYFNKH
jgi:hypothetical protein